MFIVLGVLIAGFIGTSFFGVHCNRSESSPASFGEVFRQPKKLVAERVSLDEGEAKIYGFNLGSNARVEVQVEADPKKVNVMLMTSEESEQFQKAKGSGEFTYRKALSATSILRMKESETLPAGHWAIVVQRPRESVLFSDSTSASVDVTVY